MLIFSRQVALVDEDEDKDEAFDDGDVIGREVGRRWEGGRVSDGSDHNAGGGAPRRWPKTSRPDFPTSAIGAGGTTTTTTAQRRPGRRLTRRRFSRRRRLLRHNCNRSSRGCIPPPTTASTSTARKSNARHCTLDEGGLGIESNNQQLWGHSRRRDPPRRSWMARGRSSGGGGGRRRWRAREGRAELRSIIRLRSGRCAQSWTALGWRWSGPERDLTSAHLVNDRTVPRRRVIAGEDVQR